MIPLRDDEPGKTFPVITLLLIAINAFVFIGWQLRVGIEQSVYLAALVPAELTGANASESYVHLLSSMFMHGSWMHLIGNMWFLWIFGNNIEDATGSLRFIFFYLVCGLFADAAHVIAAPHSTVPMIGASGAVSGVLGAYLLLHPRASIMTLIPLGLFTRIIEVPAFLFLIVWIGFQFLSQAMSQVAARQEGGGVAYLAHIGGFIAGILLIFVFKKKRR
jgi:membrane associated rhomboid family serine protease